jgi:hypothetical protein
MSSSLPPSSSLPRRTDAGSPTARPDASRPARTRHWATIAAIACAAVVLGWHGRECASRFPSSDAETTTLPFTQFDHPYHYYYGKLASSFFQIRRSFWGYDPTFMAGYPKTLVFPTSSTLVELTALAGGKSAAAYRTFVASALWLTPIFLGIAAATLARSSVSFTLAVAIGVVWIWCGFPTTYAVWGMAPFIVASAISLSAASMLASWLDQSGTLKLVAGTVLASIATIAHPSSPVILFVMLLPAYISRIVFCAPSSIKMHAASYGLPARPDLPPPRPRGLGPGQHAVAWLIPLLVLIAWSPWWLPAFLLRESFGTTASGFINENIGGRLMELAQAKWAEESALLIAAGGAASCLTGLGRARCWALLGGAAALFGIAYFGSYFEWAWALQPGRYSQPLYATLVVIVSVAWPLQVGRLIENPKKWLLWCQAALLAIGSVAGIRLVVPKAHAFWNLPRTPILDTRLPDSVIELAQFLKENAGSDGRILFEDHGRGPDDPFGGTNPSPLLPILAPGQYIGGPYLYTHLKTNFTQFGDGKLCGHPIERVDRRLFDQYAELYNVRWVVAWSPPMLGLAALNDDLFRPVQRFGPLQLYELRRETNWAIRGHARVEARPDRLEVFDCSPDDDGVTVLSYHWISTLRSTVPIRPILMADDPVPFIAIDDAPPHFVIGDALW